MGNTIWVNVKRDTEIECNEEDHSNMCRLDGKLDGIARERGVSSLSGFFDGSAMAADFVDFDDDADVALPEAQWYDSADGLKTIEALLNHVSNDPDLFSFPDDPSRANWRSALIEELLDCKSLLTKAAADGLPFHFAIIM